MEMVERSESCLQNGKSNHLKIVQTDSDLIGCRARIYSASSLLLLHNLQADLSKNKSIIGHLITRVTLAQCLIKHFTIMADPLSITASVISVAGAGIPLATTLYTYSDTAFKADSSV